MAFPSLNEMLQAIQASQQNAFIPAYQQAQQQKQDRLMKEQQLQKLIQEMQMTQDMHPLEMASKQAGTRYNNALSGNQELVAQETQTKRGRPGYLPALDAEQAKTVSDANLAQHNATIKSAEANTSVDSSMAMRAFFAKPGRDTATASSPEAWLKQSAIDANLQGDRMRANAAASAGGTPKNLNPTELIVRSKAAFEQASDAYRSYKNAKGIKTKAQFEADPEAQRLYEQAMRAKGLYDVATTTTKTTSAPFEGLPPVVNTTTKGGASGGWSPTPKGNGKYFVDEQGRIHIEEK